MNSSPLHSRVAAVLAKYPDLCIDGLRYQSRTPGSCYSDARFPARRELFFKPGYLRQIQTVLAFFGHVVMDDGLGSYTLKHIIERWGHEHGLESCVTNGCAILGAVLAGYQVVRQRNSPNCTFRSSK